MSFVLFVNESSIMGTMNCTDSERKVREQASLWAVRLSGAALDERQQRQLNIWLAADSRHTSALADAEMAWALAGECRDSALFERPVPRARRHGWRDVFGGTGMSAWRMAGMVASLVLVVWCIVAGRETVAPLLADYRTATGELRSLALPDGSKVVLGSDSALDLEYGPQERRVTLVRGEAIFTPSPKSGHEPRAFVVEAAGGRATALGTRYIVQRQNADHVWIGVLEHQVDVTLNEAPRSGVAQLTLQAGNSAVYSAESGIVSVGIDPQQAAGWADGYLVFQGQPLAQVLQRVGDFRSGLLMLMNRQAAAQPIHALFHLDNLDDAIATLCAQLNLHVVHLPGMTILY